MRTGLRLLLTALLYCTPCTVGAQSFERLNDESLVAFLVRIGPPEEDSLVLIRLGTSSYHCDQGGSRLSDSIFTFTWNSSEAVHFVSYEKQLENVLESEADETILLCYLLIPDGKKTYSRLQVDTIESNGGRPHVNSILAVNADRDKAKEVAVLISWEQHHYETSGILYDTQFYDNLQAPTWVDDTSFLAIARKDILRLDTALRIVDRYPLAAGFIYEVLPSGVFVSHDRNDRIKYGLLRRDGHIQRVSLPPNSDIEAIVERE